MIRRAVLLRSRLAAASLVLVLLAATGEARAEGPHDKAYWHAVIASDFEPLGDVPLPSLLRELSDFLSLPDPELRDAIAYRVLTQWLYVQDRVPVKLRRELVAEWRENLSMGIGDAGTDTVFRRSFSALMLSVAVALDNQSPWLDAGEFDRLLNSALAYLRDERDTRGFDPDKGWIHSVAHTADLLKFLARSRHLAVSEQEAILTAIAGKLSRLDHVLTHGEDERLARAVVAVVARSDADRVVFDAFLEQLKPVPLPALPTPAELAVNQNRKHLAVSLYAMLKTGGRDDPSLDEAAGRVLELLDTMM